MFYQLMLVSCAVVVLLTGCDISGQVVWEKPAAEPNRIPFDIPVSTSDASSHRVAILAPAVAFRADDLNVTGKFGNLQPGARLYVFLEDKYGYYLQYPPARIDRSRKTFTQRNVKIGNGIDQLHVCVVDRSAARVLDRKAADNDWRGMPMLPEGIEIADSIAVRADGVASK